MSFKSSSAENPTFAICLIAQVNARENSCNWTAIAIKETACSSELQSRRVPAEQKTF